MGTTAVNQPTVSKGEFARLAGVSGGRVSQWLKAGRISGEALVGVGIRQRIVVSVALSQLRARLDPSQRAINGGHTKPESPNGKTVPLADDDAAMKSALLAERQARSELVEIKRDREAGKLIRRVDVRAAAEVAAEQIVVVLENVGTLALAGRIRAAATDVAGRGELKRAIRRARAKIADAFMELANADDDVLRPTDGRSSDKTMDPPRGKSVVAGADDPGNDGGGAEGRPA